MQIKAVLMDLDGTLLPMDQDEFTKGYFKSLCRELAPYGYKPDELIKALYAGIEAMVKNDGHCTNEEAFWHCFCGVIGQKALEDKDVFDRYYRDCFPKLSELCGYNPEAKETVDKLKAMGYRVVLATNPLFPAMATENRMGWAGFSPEDFELYTTFENCCYSKPNTMYYADIMQRLGLAAGECLMVGNDVGEDMTAADIGMKVFLLTDCLLNRKGEDISVYPNGSFKQLKEYIEAENLS